MPQPLVSTREIGATPMGNKHGSEIKMPGVAGAPSKANPDRIAAGVAIYRQWEDAHGLDADGAWSPADVTVAELIRRLIQELPIRERQPR